MLAFTDVRLGKSLSCGSKFEHIQRSADSVVDDDRSIVEAIVSLLGSDYAAAGFVSAQGFSILHNCAARLA